MGLGTLAGRPVALIAALYALLLAAPGAHPGAPAPAAGHRRDRDCAAPEGPVPLADSRAPSPRRPARRPPGGRSSTTWWPPRRWRWRRRWPSPPGWAASSTCSSTPTGGGCRPAACCTGACTRDPSATHLPRHSRPAGRRLADPGGSGGAVRRARGSPPGSRRSTSGRPGRCSARAAPRSLSTGSSSWPRRGPGWWTRPTPSAAASSATCTTAPSSGWSPSPSTWGWPERRSAPPRRRARPSPTRTRRPSRPWPNCGT